MAALIQSADPDPQQSDSELSLWQPVGQQFGTESANYSDLPNPLPLPRVLADIQVLVNGSPAPLYSVAPGLIKFQVPMGAPSSGTVDVAVVRNSTGQIVGTGAVPMNVASPGIFLKSDSGPLPGSTFEVLKIVHAGQPEGSAPDAVEADHIKIEPNTIVSNTDTGGLIPILKAHIHMAGL